MSKKKRRLPSDFLFRMVRETDQMQFIALKAVNDVYSKHSQKWKLIDYYRAFEGEWSAEREQADWGHASLAVLKYDALHWYMRTLGKIGRYPNNLLLSLIEEMSVANARAAYEYTLNIAEIAQTLGRESEQFALLEEVYRLERQAVAVLLKGDERRAEMERLGAELLEFHRLKAEVQAVEVLGLCHWEPAKASFQQGSGDFPQRLESLAAEIERFHLEGMETVTGRAQLCSIKAWALSRLGKESGSAAFAQAFWQLSKDFPWVIERDFEAYYNNVYRLVANACTNENWALAKSIVDNSILVLGEESGFSQQTRLLSLDCRSLIAAYSEDIADAISTIEAIEADLIPFLDSIVDGKAIGILFCGMHTALWAGMWGKAIRFAAVLEDYKTTVNPRLRNDIRVMHLLATLRSSNHQDYNQSVANSCSLFLHRRIPKPTLHIDLVRHLKTIPSEGLSVERLRSAIESFKTTVSVHKEEGYSTNFPYLRFLEKWIDDLKAENP